MSSCNVLVAALEKRCPKRQSRIAAVLLRSTARIVADVFNNANGSRNKVEIKPVSAKNSLFPHGTAYPTNQATLHVQQLQQPRFSACKAAFLLPRCASPFRSPFFFFSHRWVRVEDGPIPLSHMPQNGTNRRLLPHAAPLPSTDLQRLHLPAEVFTTFTF